MTDQEVEMHFKEKCMHCQKLINESWCIEHGHHGCNPYCAIAQCRNQDFKPFKKKVEEE